MLPKKTKLINIPVLNDFIYTVLYNASYQEKRGLKGKYLKAAMNEVSAKAFSVNSSREEKEFILSYLGYEFCYVIYNKTSSFDKVKKIIAEQRPNIQQFGGMASEGIYLHTDLEFQRYLGLTAHILHHHNFQYNNEIVRSHYHVQKWKKTFQNKLDIQGREMDESIRETSKFLFNAMIVMDNLINLIGVTATGLKILLYFYQSRDNSIKRSKLGDVFAGFLSRVELQRALKGLIEGNFISTMRGIKEEGERSTHYSITTIGIRTVNNYFNHVYNQNSF